MIDPPKGADAAALADWAELSMLLSAAESLPRHQIKKTLRDEPDELPDAEDDRSGAEIEVEGLERMLKEDRRAERLLGEIHRRSAVAPRIYGFRVDDDVVVPADVQGRAIYVLLLWLSLEGTPFRLDGRDDEVEEAFDELCLMALRVLIGPEADGVLFARRYAQDPPTESARPTSFPEAIKWLRGRLKLPAGLEIVPSAAPEDDEGDYPARTYSDGGVDVVVWRHFKDGRAGFPILLAQCTVQLQWRPKTTDIVLDLWGDWIRFVTRPQKALAVPFAVPERSWWRDRNRTAGMILDRMRLCELLDTLAVGELLPLRASGLSEWLATEREAYLALQAAA